MYNYYNMQLAVASSAVLPLNKFHEQSYKPIKNFVLFQFRHRISTRPSIVG